MNKGLLLTWLKCDNVYIPGEQTQVSISGRTSATKSVSSDHQPEIHTPTPQENNVFDPEDDG